MSVMTNYQAVDADTTEVGALTAGQAAEQARNLDDLTAGQLAGVSDSGSDGVAITGTEAELRDWLACAEKALDAATGYTRKVTEQYVFIYGFTTQQQVDDLAEAVGMLPGDMGRWKGNDRIMIGDQPNVDKAIAWARANGRTHEVTATELFLAQPPTAEDIEEVRGNMRARLNELLDRLDRNGHSNTVVEEIDRLRAELGDDA